jgi:hypothetical protein
VLLRLFLLGKNRPLLFFLIAICAVIAFFGVTIAYIAAVRYFILIPANVSGDEAAVIIKSALGVYGVITGPIFVTIAILLIETYFYIIFGILLVSKESILRRRVILNALIVWASKKHTGGNKTNIVGEQ